MNLVMLAVFMCAIVAIAVLMAVRIVGDVDRRIQGPVSDTEAACMATDLTVEAKRRMGCQ